MFQWLGISHRSSGPETVVFYLVVSKGTLTLDLHRAMESSSVRAKSFRRRRNS